MTPSQVTGIIRAILAAIGGLFVTKGYFSGAALDWALGSIGTVVPALWSVWDNRPASIAASAQKLDGVNVQTSGAASESVKTAVANAKGA